jgi:hypothetical protein
MFENLCGNFLLAISGDPAKLLALASTQSHNFLQLFFKAISSRFRLGAFYM